MNIQDDITDCILGSKGSGKTVLLASLMESFKGKRSVFLDVLGVLNPRNNFKSAVVPNSYYCVSGDDFLSNFDKFPKNAKIVIDLEKYIGEDLIYIVDVICLKILESRIPTAVFSDEVADFMNQSGSSSHYFHLMVKNGRNYGIKPVVFATQRPQSVNKNVFDLCDRFFISAQKAPRTIDYIADILGGAGDKDIKERIRKLEKRQFLIYDGTQTTLFKVPEYPYAFQQ